ncbi:MAG: SDR family mycofactocin-dependent oxidoreductase [Gordonia sp.]|nr:SDR family mycofactocin-dependent oxidoreductase [Gordonia sp. (in: high G+C Gram-positive bacteria)]
MGKLDGKIALITGAARGQGRSHALAMASEGADIIAIDICNDIATNGYSLATEADLVETQRLVEKEDKRCVTHVVDVRDHGQLKHAVAQSVAELGGLHIVVANAGICPLGGNRSRRAFLDAVDVNLVGAINTISASYEHLGAGASIIATGSVAALLKGGTDNPAHGPGGAGYTHSKQGVARYVHDLAIALAPESIRVNAIHPCNTNTDMLHSEPMYQVFRPDLDSPTREDAEEAFPHMQLMPTSWVEPQDISEMVVFLASDSARFVTGMQMRVDAGAALRQIPAIASS